MRCPKCDYEGEDLHQCARCGIVFSKIGVRVAPRSRPAHPATSPKRPWFSRGFKWSVRAIVVVLLSLIAFIVSRPRTPEAYGLPALDGSTVSPGVVENAVRVSQEHPGVPVLKEYVASAHLLLALRLARERRFVESETSLREAETWGAPPRQLAAFRALVLSHEGSWQLASQWARRALELGEEPNRASMHHLMGEAHYYQEDLAAAIRELEKAFAVDPHPATRDLLERARRDQRVASHFGRVELPHFVIRYDETRMAAPGRLAAEELERSYQSLASELGFEPEESIAVILYTPEEYLAVGGMHETGGMFDGKIRITVRDTASNETWIPRILRHEMAHAFVRSRARARVPKWLNEGIAEYAAGIRSDDLIARLRSPPEARTLELCLLEEKCELDNFYAAAAAAVDYLVRFRGAEGLREVLDGIARGSSSDAALGAAFGKPERELVREWEAYFLRRM
jgi:hypothetical protein